MVNDAQYVLFGLSFGMWCVLVGSGIVVAILTSIIGTVMSQLGLFDETFKDIEGADSDEELTEERGTRRPRKKPQKQELATVKVEDEDLDRPQDLSASSGEEDEEPEKKQSVGVKKQPAKPADAPSKDHGPSVATPAGKAVKPTEAAKPTSRVPPKKPGPPSGGGPRDKTPDQLENTYVKKAYVAPPKKKEKKLEDDSIFDFDLDGIESDSD